MFLFYYFKEPEKNGLNQKKTEKTGKTGKSGFPSLHGRSVSCPVYGLVFLALFSSVQISSSYKIRHQFLTARLALTQLQKC